MKQKDGDKHKPSTSYSSNKGKRKLEFDKKTSNLPLSGKIVYLDVKDVRQSRSLEEKLKQLGGTIEKFLIKDVNYVISSNAPASGQKKGEKGQDRPDSPAFQSTPSPFSMGQSPSPTAIEAKKETVTRGKAILQIAKNKSSQTSVADTAKKMGIKIVSLNGAITWLDKEIRKIKPAPVSTSNKQETRRRGTKIQRLKTPYVKFEAESCHYRPIMQQLKTWPHFNTETPQGTCPFDGRALGRPQNSERGDREEAVGVGNVLSPGTPQAQRDDLSGAQQVKSQSKTAKLDEPSNCKMFGVPIVTAGEIKRERERRKRENKRKGYCECCKEKYDDVDKHMRGLQHKNFARNKKNFDCIDTLIHQGPNTVSFLQRILLRHCVQKAANRNKDSQACDDGEVLLIEECSEKQSEKGGASNLPPEQLRVKRKMNRRLKYDRKIEKVTVEKTKLNKNVETCESRLGIVLDGQHHHHSSPRKPRSGSFPRVGRESRELESTSAVVIRRSGSRGLYGSPRRSQSASGSEKTLIIRDSPIASLQPLKDFLKRHSTNTGIRDGEKSSRFDEAGGKESRKRKSGASSSPVQEEKRHRQSDQTPLGDSTSGEAVLTKPSKCNRPDGKKGGTDAVSDKIVHSQLQKCVKDKPDREHSRVTRSSPRKRLDIDIESKVTSPRKSNRLSFQTENMSPLSDIVMRAENVIELSSKSVVVISKLDMESADSQLSLTSAGSPRRRSWMNKQKDSNFESEHVVSYDDQGRVGDDPDSKDRCKSRSKPRKYRDCGNDSEVEADVIVEKSTEVDEQRSRSKKRKDRDCGKGSQADDEADVEEFKEKDDQRSRSKKRKDRDHGKGSQADDEADVEEFKEKDDQRSRSKKRKDRDRGKGSQADDEADVEEFKAKDDQRSRSKKRKDSDCGKGSQAEVTVKDCNGREAQRSYSKQKKHKDSRAEFVAQNKSDMNVECSNPGGKDIDSHKSRSPHMKKHGSKTHSDFIQNEADSIELSPTKGRSNSKKALRPSPNPDNKIQPTEVSTSSRTSPRKKHRTVVDLDVKRKDTNPSQEKTKVDGKTLRADTAGEMVICNNETVVFTKRKKWKKVVRSSPRKKGRKLCKLKLDETSCSDYSCTSAITSDVTPRKNAIPEQGESQSPVFRRRSRHSMKDLCHDVKENPESVELELKTPKRGKFCKKGDVENEEEGGTEVDTPKSGYCTTPRRRERYWRSLRSDLVDETVCDGEDRRGEKDVKYVPETTPVKKVMMSRSRTSDTEMCCSPSRSRRARKSDESYQDMSEDKSTERKSSKISDSPRSRRARKSDESYQDMSEDKSTERKCSKISDSPRSRSRSRSTRNKPFEYGENAASASVPPSPNETLKKSRSTSTEKSPKRRKSSSPKKKETRGKRKWRQSKPSSRRKTVKLNRSWLILSERSMSKLLESEGDTQPFLGFQKEESDSRLPSDLTYEEVSEVDMSDDSTREWVMDEPDQDDEHRNDSEKNLGEDDIDNLWFPQFFPSPDKASNSSWGEACDSFLQTACERRLSGQTCSTPLVLPSNKVGTPRMRNKSPYCSPHRQLDTVKEDEDLDKTLVASDSYETPKKSRKISPRNLNRDESVDKGIVYNFNYRSPQKASRQDTGHERFRATTSKDDGLCLEYNKSVDSSGRKLRLLKKASSTKKTFHMSYVSKPVKSPKPARRINISAASTVVVVSPKGKLK